MQRRVLSLIVAFLFLPAVHAQEVPKAKAPLTFEDMWKAKRLGKPAISPDGRWVVVEATTFKMDENASTSDLWLLSTDGLIKKQLTAFPGKNSGPVWSPDGKYIAFVSKRKGDISQIYVISPEGGEARQLSNLPMNPSGLKWSPDAKTIYCVVNTWPDTPDDESYKKKEKTKKDDKVQAYIIDDALFRFWDTWIADGRRPVIFAVDAETGKHKNLFARSKLTLPITAANSDSYDISPDGREICFTADTSKDIGMEFNLDLYAMPLDGSQEPRNLTTDNKVGDSNPVYSPDGKWIAFLRQTTKFFYADRVRIMLYDRTANRVGEEVTAKLDRSCRSVSWSPHRAILYFEAEDKGYHRLYSVSLEQTSEREILPMTSGATDVDPSLSSDGKRLVFLRSTFNYPAEVVVMSSQWPHEATPLGDFNDSLKKNTAMGKVEEVYFKGADGADVQMWIVFPPNFDAGKKWPLLQVVHGGPHNGITTDFSYRWNLQLFAAKGYVVSCINFHGSSGFGQKFTDSITGDMATKPFTDIMKGTDYMASQPYIDANRMATAGASYGGYMMSWMNGHTDRFKAMICHAGVYNWHSMMASDIVRSRERPLGAMPWGDLTKIDKQTPQRFAANFKTPTLVIHGEKDYRVPVTQGFEYYNTLRIKGVPTRLIYFPDENHWVLRPQNARLWHGEFFAWLEKYVGSGPTK